MAYIIMAYIILNGLYSYGLYRYNRASLTNDAVRGRLGFLYKGFENKYYYWESVVMARKVGPPHTHPIDAHRSTFLSACACDRIC